MTFGESEKPVPGVPNAFTPPDSISRRGNLGYVLETNVRYQFCFGAVTRRACYPEPPMYGNPGYKYDRGSMVVL